jgi:hypothetical protein
MERPACVNVAARDCAIEIEYGFLVIRYLGQEYYAIGWYFGCARSWRELYYVLVQDPLKFQPRTN